MNSRSHRQGKKAALEARRWERRVRKAAKRKERKATLHMVVKS